MTKHEAGNEVEVPTVTAQQILARIREIKAKSTLLMALPDEHLTRFNGIKDVKTLWAAIKTRFCKGLDKGFDGFQRLLGLLEIHEAESTNSTNELNVAYIVSTTIGHRSQAQVAMLSIRVKRFYKKTGRNLEFNEKEPVGFNETKFKCFNCHRRGHFARDYRTARNPGNMGRDTGNAGYRGRDNGKRPAREEDEKALVVQDRREEEVTKTVFDNHSSDEENSLANDRFKQGEGFHAVPSPLTGNYMPPTPNLSFAGLDDSIYKFKISETVTSLSIDVKDAPKTSTAFVEKPKEARTISAIKGNGVTAVKASAGCVWRPRVNEIDQISKDNRWICTRVDYGYPQESLKNKGIVDNGCSRHMTRNKDYLADYQEINNGGFVAFGSSRGKITSKDISGGFVAFGGSPKGGKLTGKGKIRTGKLDFEDVYFVKELKALVTKPHNKTPYKLLNDRSPRLDFIRPFGYPITILNTLDPLGKIKGKADEGFFVGHSVTSKAFRVFNTKTKKVEDNLDVRFFENKPNVAGTGPNWLFDIDSLTNSMNNMPVSAGNQTYKNAGPQDTNGTACTQDNVDVGKEHKNDTGSKNVVEPVNKEDQAYRDALDRLMSQEKEASDATDALSKEFEQGCIDQRGSAKADSTNSSNTVSNPVNATNNSGTFSAGKPSSSHPDTYIPDDTLLHVDQDDSQTPNLEDTTELRSTGIFTSAYDDDLDRFTSSVQSAGVDADFNNMESFTVVSHIPTYRVHIDHPKDQILGNLKSVVQTKGMAKKSSRAHAFVSYIHKQIRTNHKDYKNCLFACFLLQMKPKKVYRNKKDERGIIVRNKARLVAQGHRQEEGIDYDEVFALVARIEAIWIFLANASFMWFIVYQMDVKSAFLYGKIEEDVYSEERIFISQDKYVVEILKKFDFSSVRTASTPIKTQKPLVKYKEATNVDVHLYRSMIRSLMYLTASRPNIMFVVCTCSRFQVTPKLSHLHDVKRIFRRLISWQCKKQTIVATSNTKAEYVVAANYCRQSSDPPLLTGFRNGEERMEHEIELTDLVPQTPLDSPLSGGHTPGSDKGSMTLKELMNLCTTLSQKVIVKDKGNGEIGGSTAKTISAARPEVSTVEPKTPPTTTTLFDDEDVTIVDTLVKMKSQKAKEKGVAFKDVDDFARPIRDTKVTLKIQADFDKEIRKERERQDEASKATLVGLYDEVKAQIDVDHELAARLTHKEQEKFTIKERSKLLAELFKRRKKQLVKERAEAIRSKPPTKTRLRNLMMTYLQHTGRFTHAQLKSRSFKEIQKLYTKEQKWVDAFVPIGSEEDEKRVRSRKKRVAGSSSKQKSSKKQKVNDLESVDSNKELRICLKLVPADDKAINYETLDVKSPIVDCESQKLRTMEAGDVHVYRLARLDGSYRQFSTFSRMLEILDRRDVLDVHKIVIERFPANDPEGYDLILLEDLKTLMESSEDDEI
uniref:Uncharacterized protein n=1 Tax=Tanacetum cinerariifolium TaxID=118510 RepID=A0A6L2JD10_TANCI|nr:hypothetical protein [Tanacetum cinerariifolium]